MMVASSGLGLSVDVRKRYYPKARLAQIRIHQLLLGLACPASLEQVLPLGLTEPEFEMLRSFERTENLLRAQRGEPISDLALVHTSEKCSLVHQEPAVEAAFFDSHLDHQA